MRSYYLLLIFAIFIACNTGIPKEKLTVIDNITLGGPTNTFNKQFDSLLIPHKRFFNKILMMKYDEVLDDNNYYNSYYTTLFNFSDYQVHKNSVEHLGFIAPVT